MKSTTQPNGLTFSVNVHTTPQAKKITQEDVWGNYELQTKGMIIAKTNDTCPIFKDKVPYKSVTVICEPSQQNEVEYWLEFVHGGGSVSKSRIVAKNANQYAGKLAIRSDYQCW